MSSSTNLQAIETARTYYNSSDADNFYSEVWGGEDIHIGIYESADESIAAASRRTVDRMAEHLEQSPSGATILDLGSGYGGAARRLASARPGTFVCLNLSEEENRRNRDLNEEAGLSDRISVVDGRFEEIPMREASVEVVWSQDAILHSPDRLAVLGEVDRVLTPGGRFVFTDPMRTDDCPPDVLQPILDRIHLSDLGSPSFYLDAAADLGWDDAQFESMPEQLVTHYRRVLEETRRREDDLVGLVSPDYLRRMKTGLRHWIAGGEAGHLAWGIFHFRKPA